MKSMNRMVGDFIVVGEGPDPSKEMMEEEALKSVKERLSRLWGDVKFKGNLKVWKMRIDGKDHLTFMFLVFWEYD